LAPSFDLYIGNSRQVCASDTPRERDARRREELRASASIAEPIVIAGM
jgi:hypothetical protein